MALKAGVTLGAIPEAREAAVGTILEHHDAIKGIVDIHCEPSGTFASGLPLPPNVLICILYLRARWDGGLGHVRKEDIQTPVRDVCIGYLVVRYRGFEANKPQRTKSQAALAPIRIQICVRIF